MKVRPKISGINRARGVTPTASVWDTDPTNLANSTDGNWANPTGIGDKTVGEWGWVGELKFDMGAVYNVEVRGKILCGNTIVAGGSCPCTIWASEDDVTYYSAENSESATMFGYIENDTEIFFISNFCRGRYILLRWEARDAAGLYKGAVYNIQAIDMGL